MARRMTRLGFDLIDKDDTCPHCGACIDEEDWPDEKMAASMLDHDILYGEGDSEGFLPSEIPKAIPRFECPWCDRVSAFVFQKTDNPKVKELCLWAMRTKADEQYLAMMAGR